MTGKTAQLGSGSNSLPLIHINRKAPWARLRSWGLLGSLALLLNGTPLWAQWATPPGYPQGGYPQQQMPMQGYPQQQMPMMQGYPQQQMPMMQGYPQQQMPMMQGYPPAMQNAGRYPMAPGGYPQAYPTAAPKAQMNMPEDSAPSIPAETMSRPGSSPSHGKIYGPEMSPELLPAIDDQGETYGHRMPPEPERTRDKLVPHRDDFTFSVGYLQSFLKPAPMGVPLLTTGTVAGQGVVGTPGTSVLFGNDSVRFNQSGIISNMQYWFEDEHLLSLDAGGFYLFPEHKQYNQGSDVTGIPVLSRPAINGLNGKEIAFINTLPNISSGHTSIDNRVEYYGGDISLRYTIPVSPSLQFQPLFGYRYVTLQEQLNIGDTITVLAPNVFTFIGAPIGPGQRFSDNDSFHTRNQFHGSQVGGAVRWQISNFFIEGVTKIAAGANLQTVSIDGSSTLHNANGTTSTAQGGILALSTNIGDHSRTVFGVIPEGGLNVGIDILRHVRIKTGYSFLYWNNVVRPGDQIDRTINPHLVPTAQSFGTAGGPNRPAFAFQDSTFFSHSANMAIEFHW